MAWATVPKPSPSFGLGRHTLGIFLLLFVVVLWTASNFLASTILADATFSKPFFVTYFNTSFFILSLVPSLARRLVRLYRTGAISHAADTPALVPKLRALFHLIDADELEQEREHESGEHEHLDETRPFLPPPRAGDVEQAAAEGVGDGVPGPAAACGTRLGLKATARVSLEFCLLWFTANYFAFACLQHTTVSSTTILTSTSGLWTLIFGVVTRVETFTRRKLLGVLTSLTGILLISRVDLSSSDSPDNGSFPFKGPGEMALGDAMAGISAVLYGVYTVVMKKKVGDEGRVDMPLFFGLVGLINTFLLWPGFFVLHLLGIETLGLPETGRVWMIITINAGVSLVSDVAWAYAMLLTTPLIVTVGLSLTIPLSLIGQMVIQNRYSSALYWIGATFVFFSFMIVNHAESR